MSHIKINRHLNIFNYYGVSDDHNPRENNLSRALAITLSNDRRFLNKIFKRFVLDEVYSELFSLDYNLIEDEDIYIDIQTSANSTKNIERKYSNYIGVLLSNTEGNFTHRKIEEIESAKTNNPIPDILIGIRDTLIVIEAKLDNCNQGDFAQLKRHVEAIIDNNSENDQDEDVELIYMDASWSSILRNAMDLYDDETNAFINDFIDFVRRNYTNLLPVIPLQDIKVEAVDSERSKEYQYKLINQRLKVIKTITTRKLFKKEDLSDKGKRYSIPIGFEWASEANLYFHEDSKSIKLKIWPADTKGQGIKIYKENKQIEWIEREIIQVNNNDYKMKVKPYIKFANWNKGIGFIRDAISKDKYKRTHCYETFHNISGRWKRTKVNNEWDRLEADLDEIIGTEWRNDLAWSESFIDSGKTTIDISFGMEVEITIPYKRAQELDTNKDDENLAQEIFDILKKIKELIDQ